MRQGWKYVCCGFFAAAIVMGGSRADAQGATARPFEGTVRLGFGNLAPTPKTFDMRAGVEDAFGSDSLTGRYDVKGGSLTDISGSVITRSGVGFGVGFSRNTSKADATFTLRLDHPDFHPVLTDTMTKKDLERSQSGVHLFVSYDLPLKGPISVSFFGGPSRLSVTQDLAEDLLFDEVFTSTGYRAALLDVDIDDQKGSAWGYNLGADVSYKLTRMFSVGLLIRHTRATVDIANELQSQIDDDDVTESVKVGGLEISGGIRLRF